ncbi:50S ribosomal protein L31 [Patescibacteria group bacterium]|nr:50S ribosomal protein L31 [Patescibacteria group bacterium]MBU1910776.1 50S ribosomal protein L31 [Verrucomicrobiota bacterium]
MKQAIHPKYYSDCKVTCACGNTFTTGSTLKEIKVEICSKCHPFFTGKQTFADTKGRIEKFLEKVEKGKKYKKRVKTKSASGGKSKVKKKK